MSGKIRKKKVQHQGVFIFIFHWRRKLYIDSHLLPTHTFIFTVRPRSSALHLKLLPPTSTVSFLPLLFTNKRTHTDIPWHLVLLMLDGGCHGNTSLTLFLGSLAEKTQKLTQEAEEVQGARIIRSHLWRTVERTEVIPRLGGSSVLDCLQIIKKQRSLYICMLEQPRFNFLCNFYNHCCVCRVNKYGVPTWKT